MISIGPWVPGRVLSSLPTLSIPFLLGQVKTPAQGHTVRRFAGERGPKTIPELARQEGSGHGLGSSGYWLSFCISPTQMPGHSFVF